ncbi:MAG: DNA polymerase III subunit beta [Xanthobacteraceae bacterium]
MTLTVQRTDLVRTLTHAIKAVESRNTIPILANVLLSADAGKLTVTATDLDIQISSTAPAEGTLETTVDAKRLSDIARRLSGDVVTMTLADSKLTVKSGRSRFVLPTLPVVDFPRLDAGDMPEPFALDFASLVAPVKFAISTEATRYYLCGVHLHNTAEGGIRAVATDGHRLAHSTATGMPEIPPVIIPAKTVGLVPAGEVQVSMSANKVRFATADTIIVSKLIDGTFPAYDRVIPRGNDKVAKVDRKELASAVARASAVASERGRAAKFTVANDNISIDMRGDDGTAHEDVPAQYSGEPVEIGFNTMYLSDILAVVPGDEVSIAFADSGTPAIFRGKGDWLGLVMPVRV